MGVSCSILMLRNDLIGKRLPLTKVSVNTEQYIDELTDYTNIKNKKLFVLIPENLIFCIVLIMIIKKQMNLDIHKIVEEKNVK
jgi:hypothetical protein